jgi:hypothetical protein
LEWGLVYEGDTIFPRYVRSGVMHGEGNRVFIHALRLFAATGAASGSPGAQTSVVVSGDLANSYVGATLSGTYTATGGIPPYTYAATSGTFPSGLTLAASGSWSGSPDTADTYSWTVTATDSEGNTGTLADAATISALACGAESSYEGGESFPAEFDVLLGSDTGTVALRITTGPVPDKCEVWFDGVKVVDTGYLGDTDEQSSLNAALAAYSLPPESITQRTGTTTNADTDWAAGEWDEFSFNKTTATTSATVKVYGPIEGTIWNLALSCPGGFPE